MEFVTDELFYEEGGPTAFDPNDKQRHFRVGCTICDRSKFASLDAEVIQSIGYKVFINDLLVGGFPMIELAEECSHAQEFMDSIKPLKQQA